MSYERRKIKIGKVVSDKMDKTIVVSVESTPLSHVLLIDTVRLQPFNRYNNSFVHFIANNFTYLDFSSFVTH
jgi:hypothetical protein